MTHSMYTIPATAIRYVPSGTESVAQQLWSLLPALQHDATTLGRTEMVYAINEISKSVINWIGKGQEEQLRSFSKELDRFLSSDAEMDDPLLGLSQKRKFGANLAFLLELANVYQHSDLELKDYHLLMMEDKVSRRLRKVLLAFFQGNRWLNTAELSRIAFDTAQQSADMISERERKQVQRDLQILMKQGLIQRIALSEKKHVYEATPRAFAYKTEIMQRELTVNVFLHSQHPVFVEAGDEAETFPAVPSYVLTYQRANT
jgi:Fe2+ or Zn2+ uptake regulation protein